MFFHAKGCEWLIVGLGNPGSEYERTRHNVGYRAIDILAAKLGTKIDRSHYRALISPIVECGGHRVILMKPLTYMNSSGEAVKLCGAFYKIPPEHILVLSDDISLDVGRLRVRPNGSAGGHNGLKSIIGMLGSQNFPRVKIGVGQKPHPDYNLADWVLGKFSAEEELSLKAALENAAAAAEDIIRNDTTHAANRFNGK